MPGKNEIAVFIRLRDQFSAQFTKVQQKVRGGLKGLQDKILSFQGVAAGLGGMMVFKVGKSFVQTAADMETLKTRLIGITGSVGAANAAFKRIQETASQVPYTIRDITEATVSLEAFGAKSAEWQRPLIDLAAFMGVELPEAAQAVGRAFAGGAGAADILRERGVLTQVKLKTGFDDLSKMTLPEFRKALLATLTDPGGKIAGGAKRLSGTWTGVVSMMQDAWTNFQLEVMDDANMEALKQTVEAVTIAMKGLTTGFAKAREAVGSYMDWLWEHTGAVKAAYVEQKKTNTMLGYWEERLKAILPRLEEMRDAGDENTEAYRRLVKEASTLDDTIRKFSGETAQTWHARLTELEQASDDLSEAQGDLGDATDDNKKKTKALTKEMQKFLTALQDASRDAGAFKAAFEKMFPEEARRIQKEVADRIWRMRLGIKDLGDDIEFIAPSLRQLEMPDPDPNNVVRDKAKSFWTQMKTYVVDWRQFAEMTVNQFSATFIEWMTATQVSVASIENQMALDWSMIQTRMADDATLEAARARHAQALEAAEARGATQEELEKMREAFAAEYEAMRQTSAFTLAEMGGDWQAMLAAASSPEQIGLARRAWKGEMDQMVEDSRHGFGDMLKEFMAMMAKMMAKMMLAAALKALLFGPSGAVTGGLFGRLGIQLREGGIIGEPLRAQKGLMLTKPTPIIAGEAGPEVIFPLDKLEKMMVRAVERGQQRGGSQVTFQIYTIDGQSTKDWLRREGARALMEVGKEGYALIPRRAVRD